MQLLTPLESSAWPGEALDLCPGPKIKHFTQTRDLQGWEQHLSSDGRDRLFFDWLEDKEPSPAARINLLRMTSTITL